MIYGGDYFVGQSRRLFRGAVPFLTISFLLLNRLPTFSADLSGTNESIAVPAYRTNFAIYLTNRPPLDEMEADLSNNRYWPLISQPGTEWPTQYTGFTTWQCSFQPEGFFAAVKSNTPLKSYRGLIYGESENDYWSFTPETGVAVVSKDPARGWTVDNYFQSGGLMAKQRLLDVLNLGI